MIDPTEVGAAIERVSVAWREGYELRAGDIVTLLKVARLATSPEMTAMREAARNYLHQTENYSPEHDFADEQLDVCMAALALARAEVARVSDLIPMNDTNLKAAVENAKGTLEEMANRASVDMAIWDRHANAVLDLCARVVELEEAIGWSERPAPSSKGSHENAAE